MVRDGIGYMSHSAFVSLQATAPLSRLGKWNLELTVISLTITGEWYLIIQSYVFEMTTAGQNEFSLLTKKLRKLIALISPFSVYPWVPPLLSPGYWATCQIPWFCGKYNSLLLRCFCYWKTLKAINRGAAPTKQTLDKYFIIDNLVGNM